MENLGLESGQKLKTLNDVDMFVDLDLHRFAKDLKTVWVMKQHHRL